MVKCNVYVIHVCHTEVIYVTYMSFVFQVCIDVHVIGCYLVNYGWWVFVFMTSIFRNIICIKNGVLLYCRYLHLFNCYGITFFSYFQGYIRQEKNSTLGKFYKEELLSISNSGFQLTGHISCKTYKSCIFTESIPAT